MSNPKTCQFDLPATGRPSDVTILQEWYPGVQNYWAQSTSKRIVGDHIAGVVAIVIHATAGSNSAGAVSVMHPPPGEQAASFHWLVPDEDEPQHGRLIWACVREKDAAWHVQNTKHHPDVNNDKTRVNHWSLGIEIVNQQSGGDSFSDWQVAATAQLVRYCWAKYPSLKHVVSHAKLDPERRNDPGANFPWERFKQLVLFTFDPLQAIDMPLPGDGVESVLDKWKTATIEEEEANFGLENTKSDKLHQVEEDLF